MAKKPLTTLWKKAKLLAEAKNVEQALPILEKLLIHVSDASNRGIDVMEGVKVDLWKERFWLAIENDLGILPEYREEEK